MLQSTRSISSLLSLSALLLPLCLACSDGEEIGGMMEGSLGLSGETPAAFSAELTVQKANKFDITTQGSIQGLKIRVAQNDADAAEEGEVQLSLTSDPSVTFIQGDESDANYAYATAGTLTITQAPTADEPIWKGTIANVEAEFSDGTPVVLTDTSFEATFAEGSFD